MRRLLAAEGVSTIFNLLGPLLNPARPAHQLVGVYSGAMLPTYAEVLRQLGRRSAWAVHGAGGMDELSTLGASPVCRFGDDGGPIRAETVTPEDAGLPRVANLDELRGGTAEDNARTLIGILSGEIGGARRDMVLLNAAAGVRRGRIGDESGRKASSAARGAIESGRARGVGQISRVNARQATEAAAAAPRLPPGARAGASDNIPRRRRRRGTP